MEGAFCSSAQVKIQTQLEWQSYIFAHMPKPDYIDHLCDVLCGGGEDVVDSEAVLLEVGHGFPSNLVLGLT